MAEHLTQTLPVVQSAACHTCPNQQCIYPNMPTQQQTSSAIPMTDAAMKRPAAGFFLLGFFAFAFPGLLIFALPSGARPRCSGICCFCLEASAWIERVCIDCAGASLAAFCCGIGGGGVSMERWGVSCCRSASCRRMGDSGASREGAAASCCAAVVCSETGCFLRAEPRAHRSSASRSSPALR